MTGITNELTVSTVKSTLSSTEIEKRWLEISGLTKSKFDKELTFALQQVAANPFLLKCSPESFKVSFINVASIGLSLNPALKYAYLVPRYNSKKRVNEICLDPSYMGLVKLLTDSGAVSSIECYIVHENDEHAIDLASDQKIIKHVPAFCKGQESGNPVFCYSLAHLHDGRRHVEIMPISEIMKIRDKSESYKAYKKGKATSCIWVSDEGEMIRKTVIKRHFKHLPKSGNLEKVAEAIQLDHDVNGYDKPIGVMALSMAEKLINDSNLSPDEKDSFISHLPSIETQTELDSFLEPILLNGSANEKLDVQLQKKLHQ